MVASAWYRPAQLRSRAACVVTLALVAATPALVRAQTAVTSQGPYEEAQALIGQKRYADALAKLREVTDARPDFAPGWFARGLAARRAGQCSDAIPAYRRYAALKPADAEPYFGLGLCLRDTGDRAAAVVALRRFVELEQRPGQQRWLETARGLIAQMEPAPAVVPGQVTPPPMVVGAATTTAAPMPTPTATTPGTTLTPGRGSAAFVEAQRLRDDGKIEPALGKFAEAVGLDPDLSAARAAWGELLIKLHREAEAISVLRAAVERNPQYALAWYELGFALRETGRFSEAVDAYRRYIALRPTDPDPHYGVARALQKLGRDAEAARSFATYVAMENRPGEERWVASARAELATLHQRSSADRPATIAAPAAPPPPAAPLSAAPAARTTVGAPAGAPNGAPYGSSTPPR